MKICYFDNNLGEYDAYLRSAYFENLELAKVSKFNDDNDASCNVNNGNYFS